MIKHLKTLFSPKSAKEIADETLAEAERLAQQHAAAAAHHQELADLYAGLADFLRNHNV